MKLAMVKTFKYISIDTKKSVELLIGELSYS